MKNIKQILLKSPEYILIAAVIFYWASSGIGMNPIAIVLIVILVLQIIFKYRIIGFIIPSLLIITCLFLLMALISEFNEFPSFNAEAKKLLFVGLSYFISTIMIAGIMIYKYSMIGTSNNKNKQIETC